MPVDVECRLNVAVKIMQLENVKRASRKWQIGREFYDVDECGRHLVCIEGNTAWFENANIVPEYEREIEFAWLVIEKMNELYHGASWMPLYGRGELHLMTGERAAQYICRTALIVIRDNPPPAKPEDAKNDQSI